MDNDIHAGTLMRSCLDSITAVHTVYSTMLVRFNDYIHVTLSQYLQIVLHIHVL